MKMRKSKILFPAGLALSFWALAIINLGYPASALAATVKLREGTPVILSLSRDVVSEMVRIGDSIDFVVVRDVEVEGKVVINTGTSATGRVLAVEKKGVMGKPGRVEVSIKEVRAVDGTIVALRARVGREGKGNQVMAIILGLLCILGFFVIKGGSAVIPSGTEVKAYVDYAVDINV